MRTTVVDGALFALSNYARMKSRQKLDNPSPARIIAGRSYHFLTRFVAGRRFPHGVSVAKATVRQSRRADLKRGGADASKSARVSQPASSYRSTIARPARNLGHRRQESADPSGAVLPGVAIMVTNEETGVFREVVTTSNGSYFVSQMVPGRYRLTREAGRLQGPRSPRRRLSKSERR